MIYSKLYDFDKLKRDCFGEMLCGVDEAGRGPLAGPVCCAAVILKPDSVFDGLNDSKKVSEKNRARLFIEITEQALAYKIVFIDNNEIDKLNILGATMEGMKQAVNGIDITPQYVLIDGNKIPQGVDNAEYVIKGDANSASIAAASILAKFSRDAFMKEIDLQYPQYGFAKHKGYPTKEHYAAIDCFGICEYHRKSFLKGRI